ncbi:MAG: mobile mystery protein B [Chlamydiales bacterium]|nr:mobile mystery protein B [Chlamydiales bacterium]
MFSYPEGATPIDDISGLKPPWVKTQQDLNMVEAENISIGINKYLLKSIDLPQRWFNVSTLKKIHRDMLFDVWEWAGKFRKTQTSIGIKPYQIPEALENLCSDVQFWCSEACELTLVEQAARVHHQLVLIHPYPNGNGRFSRLVSDRYLKAWKSPFPTWPTELSKDGRCRKCYITALKEADAGNYEALIQYMIKYGAKDPELSELLAHTFFRQNFKGERLVSLVKAYIRRGYCGDEEKNAHHPLNIALRNNLREVALLLITNGADFKRKDRSGLNGFECALTKELYDLAHEMVKRGYPYTPRHPNPQLKVPYQNLYHFDLYYF